MRREDRDLSRIEVGSKPGKGREDLGRIEVGSKPGKGREDFGDLSVGGLEEPWAAAAGLGLGGGESSGEEDDCELLRLLIS